MKFLTRIILFFVSSLFVFIANAGLHSQAISFSEEYSRHMFLDDKQWLKRVTNPALVEELSEKNLTLDWFLENRRNTYFSERSKTIKEEIGVPSLLHLDESWVAIVPWRRQIDLGIYLGTSLGAYILFYEKSGSWTVYDNDCSYVEFLANIFPNIGSLGDISHSFIFKPSGTVVAFP